MAITKRIMYPPQKDSPTTFLMGNISETDTVMTVANVATLPTVPFPFTLGINQSITETVIVTEVNSTTKVLTITRQPGAIAWVSGTQCARVFTAADLLSVQQNVSDTIDTVNDMESDISGFGEAIDALETTVGDESSGLVKGLADEITRAITAENTEKTRAQAAETSINNAKPNRTELAQLIVDWVYSQDDTKVLLTITRYNANTQQTTQYTKTLPVVSAIAMGVMPPESYNEITSLRSDVTALQQQGGRFINESFGTKSALESYIVPDSVNVGDFCFVLDDEVHGGNTTRWIYNNIKGTSTDIQTTNGFAFGYIVTYDPVGIADSNTLGLVKSDVGTTDGKVFVETDGTMSLIGWDDLNDELAEKLDKSGGTMSGSLILSGDPETDLEAATKKYVDDHSSSGGSTIYWGTCSTAVGTAAKIVTISGFTADSLVAGAMIIVTMTNGNSSTSATLNVSSTGAKGIRYKTAAITSPMINTNQTVIFLYNGTYWEMLTPDAFTLANAALPISGGTMSGNLILQPPAIGTSAARNIIASTTDLTAGSSTLNTGNIYLVYE